MTRFTRAYAELAPVRGLLWLAVWLMGMAGLMGVVR